MCCWYCLPDIASSRPRVWPIVRHGLFGAVLMPRRPTHQPRDTLLLLFGSSPPCPPCAARSVISTIAELPKSLLLAKNVSHKHPGCSSHVQFGTFVEAKPNQLVHCQEQRCRVLIVAGVSLSGKFDVCSICLCHHVATRISDLSLHNPIDHV
jgi:hypothetical protein